MLEKRQTDSSTLAPSEEETYETQSHPLRLSSVSRRLVAWNNGLEYSVQTRSEHSKRIQSAILQTLSQEATRLQVVPVRMIDHETNDTILQYPELHRYARKFNKVATSGH